MTIPVVTPLAVPEPTIIKSGDVKDLVTCADDIGAFGFGTVDATLGKYGYVSARRFKYLSNGIGADVVGNRAFYVATGEWSNT